MSIRVGQALLAAVIAILVSANTRGQALPSADVTFQVPVQLSRLPSNLSKIRVDCDIRDPGEKLAAHRGFVDVPIVAGAVNQTVTVTVPVPGAAVSGLSGQRASYTCRLFGWKTVTSVSDWVLLSSVSQTFGAPTPVLTPDQASLAGIFVW